uniref:Acrosin-like isoform X2 n=1 Tax=Geotrypetes seraphini TaxID=260995 RepID=A0A6P8SEZ2_GEOSA|nr:acrosin-like isoform X2 [Geotrypetes seraphini]
MVLTNTGPSFEVLLSMTLDMPLSLFFADCSKRPLFNAKRSSRIVGGIDSLPGAWPWLVSIQKPSFSDYVHLCGGSLLNDKWIVTAAHCFNGQERKAYKFRIVAGANQLSDLGSQAEILSIRQLIIHRDYNPETERNDIALVEMDRPITFNNYIQPACFPDSSIHISEMDWCYTSGWGVTEEKSNEPADVLQEGRVEIIPLQRCNSSTWYNGAIGPYNLCAGYEQGGIDSCQGDGGGPLMCKEKTSSLFFVVGITSWGRGCAQALSPGVYTSTQYFHNWILKKIQPKITTQIPETSGWSLPSATSKPLPQFEKPTEIGKQEISDELMMEDENQGLWSEVKPEYKYEDNDTDDDEEEEEEEDENEEEDKDEQNEEENEEVNVEKENEEEYEEEGEDEEEVEEEVEGGDEVEEDEEKGTESSNSDEIKLLSSRNFKGNF